MLEATVSMYPGLEEDQIKLYVHCELFGGITLCCIVFHWILGRKGESGFADF